MGGRTMPTECPHGKVSEHWCQACSNESMTRWYSRRHPADAVAQLVADGVLVERECAPCRGTGTNLRATATSGMPLQLDVGPCNWCKSSGKDGTYRLVLDEGEGT